MQVAEEVFRAKSWKEYKQKISFSGYAGKGKQFLPRDVLVLSEKLPKLDRDTVDYLLKKNKRILRRLEE